MDNDTESDAILKFYKESKAVRYVSFLAGNLVCASLLTPLVLGPFTMPPKTSWAIAATLVCLHTSNYIRNTIKLCRQDKKLTGWWATYAQIYFTHKPDRWIYRTSLAMLNLAGGFITAPIVIPCQAVREVCHWGRIGMRKAFQLQKNAP